MQFDKKYIKLKENWKKRYSQSLFFPIEIFDFFGHFGQVLLFCNEKNTKINFKNIKKYENYWKNKYDYLCA